MKEWLYTASIRDALGCTPPSTISLGPRDVLGFGKSLGRQGCSTTYEPTKVRLL